MARSFAAAVLLLIVFYTNVYGQSALPRSIPEREGVSSQAIINFLDSTVVGRNEFHSFMLVRHGKVIAEGWWNPYRPELKHTMYSCSKSFTATAVGIAVRERKLKVSDRVISFFPDQLPDTVSQFLRELTVKDLLTMSAGQDPDPTFTVAIDTNWVKGFLATPIVYKPGSKFKYNSLATYMLSAIVQKATGQKVIDYLTPRLFNPLGIQEADWETDPKGINVGGWGLRVKTEDMAKFGQLFLNEGKWGRKRVLSKKWVKEASSSKILQNPEYSQAKRDSSDWEQGYCYQMWRGRNKSYRADGALGQFIVIMPEQDAVVAITSETTDMASELEGIWKYLLPGMKKKKLPPNDSLANELSQQLRSLSLPLPGNSNTSELINDISGKRYDLNANDHGFRGLSFSFDENNICTMNVETDTSSHDIRLGKVRWALDSTTLPGPSLVAAARNSYKGLPPFKVAGEYNWRNDDRLEIVLRYIESPHTQTITCHFNEKKLMIELRNSFSPGAIVLNGQLAE
jgi:CubicO group peptidase (beta-lactamase class C family)